MNDPLSVESSADLLLQETRLNEEAGLDNLAYLNPVMYDALRTVSDVWVTEMLHGDRRLIEGAMILASWVEGRMEFTAFLRQHPELAAQLRPQHDVLRLFPGLVPSPGSHATQPLLERELRQRIVGIHRFREAVSVSSAPPREEPVREMPTTQSGLRRRLESLLRGLRRQAPTPGTLLQDRGVRLPLDPVLDGEIRQRPLTDPALLEQYTRIVAKRDGVPWIEACMHQVPQLAPELRHVSQTALREFLVCAVGECLVRANAARERALLSARAEGLANGEVADIAKKRAVAESPDEQAESIADSLRRRYEELEATMPWNQQE